MTRRIIYWILALLMPIGSIVGLTIAILLHDPSIIRSTQIGCSALEWAALHLGYGPPNHEMVALRLVVAPLSLDNGGRATAMLKNSLSEQFRDPDYGDQPLIEIAEHCRPVQPAPYDTYRRQAEATRNADVLREAWGADAIVWGQVREAGGVSKLVLKLQTAIPQEVDLAHYDVITPDISLPEEFNADVKLAILAHISANVIPKLGDKPEGESEASYGIRVQYYRDQIAQVLIALEQSRARHGTTRTYSILYRAHLKLAFRDWLIARQEKDLSKSRALANLLTHLFAEAPTQSEQPEWCYCIEGSVYYYLGEHDDGDKVANFVKAGEKFHRAADLTPKTRLSGHRWAGHKVAEGDSYAKALVARPAGTSVDLAVTNLALSAVAAAQTWYVKSTAAVDWVSSQLTAIDVHSVVFLDTISGALSSKDEQERESAETASKAAANGVRMIEEAVSVLSSSTKDEALNELRDKRKDDYACLLGDLYDRLGFFHMGLGDLAEPAARQGKFEAAVSALMNSLKNYELCQKLRTDQKKKQEATRAAERVAAVKSHLDTAQKRLKSTQPVSAAALTWNHANVMPLSDARLNQATMTHLDLRASAGGAVLLSNKELEIWSKVRKGDAQLHLQQ